MGVIARVSPPARHKVPLVPLTSHSVVVQCLTVSLVQAVEQRVKVGEGKYQLVGYILINMMGNKYPKIRI